MLHDPLPFGRLTAPNRIWMAPLTRCRAGEGNVPHAPNALYYAQRASAGLLISEATPVCPEGHGYPSTPGIHTQAQVEGWRLVTDAVHNAGGRIFCQLWHVGRLSLPDYQPGGALPVAPSAIAPGGEGHAPDGTLKPRPTPRALETHEIPGVVEHFRTGARLARQAGFDGVEIHGANGYLIDQFLRTGSNTRTDDYGGEITHRARFLFEVLETVLDEWGPGRVGIRLSPSGDYHGMADADPRATFGHVVKRLNDYPLAYAHIMRSLNDDPAKRTTEVPIAFFRELYRGVLVTNGRFTREEAEQYLKDGIADAVAFGKAFIANPDLPERFARQARGENVALNTPDPSTFYVPGPKGYTDYPTLAETPVANR